MPGAMSVLTPAPMSNSTGTHHDPLAGVEAGRDAARALTGVIGDGGARAATECDDHRHGNRFGI
jgi:hypothetical protein